MFKQSGLQPTVDAQIQFGTGKIKTRFVGLISQHRQIRELVDGDARIAANRPRPEGAASLETDFESVSMIETVLLAEL